MKKATERDTAIEALLRRTSGSTADSYSAGACPGPELIAAWSEGTLAPDEAATVESHLATCASCREMLAVFARTEPLPVASESFWRRWRLQWAVPIAAAATVVALYVAAPDDRQTNVAIDATSRSPAAPPPQPPSPSAAPDVKAPAAKRQAAARQDAPAVAEQSKAETESRAGAVESDRFEARAPQPTLRDQNAAAQERAAGLAAAAPPQNRAADQGARQEVLQRAEAPIEVLSPDPLVRWRILPGGRLERSTNAGKTWEPVPLPDGVNVVAVRPTSATTAIVTAADGRQFRTEDQGKSWVAFTD